MFINIPFFHKKCKKYVNICNDYRGIQVIKCINLEILNH